MHIYSVCIQCIVKYIQSNWIHWMRTLRMTRTMKVHNRCVITCLLALHNLDTCVCVDKIFILRFKQFIINRSLFIQCPMFFFTSVWPVYYSFYSFQCINTCSNDRFSSEKKLSAPVFNHQILWFVEIEKINQHNAFNCERNESSMIFFSLLWFEIQWFEDKIKVKLVIEIIWN